MNQASEVHAAVFDALRDKVQADRYPSSQQLDLLEQSTLERDRGALVETLLEKVRAERYPSPAMVRRLIRLADSVSGQ
jgi:hypothetical protein